MKEVIIAEIDIVRTIIPNAGEMAALGTLEIGERASSEDIGGEFLSLVGAHSKQP